METEYLKLKYRSRNADGMHNLKLDQRRQKRTTTNDTENTKTEKAKWNWKLKDQRAKSKPEL